MTFMRNVQNVKMKTERAAIFVQTVGYSTGNNILTTYNTCLLLAVVGVICLYAAFPIVNNEHPSLTFARHLTLAMPSPSRTGANVRPRGGASSRLSKRFTKYSASVASLLQDAPPLAFHWLLYAFNFWMGHGTAIIDWLRRRNSFPKIPSRAAAKEFYKIPCLHFR